MRDRDLIVEDIRGQARLLLSEPSDGPEWDRSASRMEVLLFELRALEPQPDPFNCPKCGRHDFGLIRESRLLGKRDGFSIFAISSQCTEPECPLST